MDILLSHGATLHIHSVRSEDNASDAASPNFDLMLMSLKQRASSTPLGRAGPDIVKRCWEEMRARVKGWRLREHQMCPELMGLDGIRHGENAKSFLSLDFCS